jgi:hypothetical protein
MRALLIGREPDRDLGWTYTDREPWEGVVVGSMDLGQLLCFREERVLAALGEGKPVILYTPGLPQLRNRALGAELSSACRKLKNWGVVFTDGGKRRLITAREAQELDRQGRQPGAGAVLTPLAKEILEGKQ